MTQRSKFFYFILSLVYFIPISSMAYFNEKKTQNNAPLIDLPSPSFFVDQEQGESDEDSDSQIDSQPLSLEEISQQMRIFKRQLKAYQSLDLPEQIDELQKEIRELKGKLAVYEHQFMQKKAFFPNSANSLVQSKQKDSEFYQQAFNQIQSKNYSKALLLMQKFIRNYPKSDYLPDAYYWLGELYLMKGNMQEANKAFKTIELKYQTSNKLPQAKLKLAVILIKKGETNQAKNQLNNLIKSFPNTPSARLAKLYQQTID